MTTHKFDIFCIGGGISGLWIHKLAQQLGYNSMLVSGEDLGSGQTIHSQAIIHGGIKYSLTGDIGNTAKSVSSMPARWRGCLDGATNKHKHFSNTNLDLRGVKLASEHHYLWTSNNWRSKLGALFAQKAMQADVQEILPVEYPFSNKHNKLYQLNEFVIDAPGLLAHLLDASSMYKLAVTPDMISFDEKNDLYLQINDIKIKSHCFVLAAGAGNTALAKKINTQYKTNVATQKRPLHMLALYDDKLPPIFAHAVTTDTLPNLTITTHKNKNNENIWYIGGKIAEESVDDSLDSLSKKATKELMSLLPSMQLKNPLWKSLIIERAEAKQPLALRPNGPQLTHIANNIVALWPTKLTCAPLLGDTFATWLAEYLPKPNTPSNTMPPLASLKVANAFYHDLGVF